MCKLQHSRVITIEDSAVICNFILVNMTNFRRDRSLVRSQAYGRPIPRRRSISLRVILDSLDVAVSKSLGRGVSVYSTYSRPLNGPT